MSEYLSDPDGAKARARKASYGGQCVDCGKRTDGSGGRAKAAERCSSCRHAYEKSDAGRHERQTWTREAVIEAIRAYAREFGTPPAKSDWCPHQAEFVLGDRARAERARERIGRGEWPHGISAVRRFGSWNAAIEAAGFTPRRRGGFAENKRRAAA